MLDWQPPHAKWFVGGTLNASVNCVRDRHVRGPRRNKAAIIWEGEPGDRRTLTYFDLFREVRIRQRPEVARREERRSVAIYLPLIPELVISLLPGARIGDPQRRLRRIQRRVARDRINDSQCKLLITARRRLSPGTDRRPEEGRR